MTHQLFSAIDKIFHSHPQKGAILVLFAITFPFLMAFSAIAVDLGTVYVQRVHLQNAADAAALAGAYQLGNSSDAPAVNSAVSYTAKNSPSDITVTSSDSTMPSEEKQINLSSDINRKSSYSTIEVQLRERVPLYFFRYFGMENMPIAVTATAKYVPGSHSIFGHAIIGAATTSTYYNYRKLYPITINHSNTIINGDMQTNGQIYLDGPNEATLNGSLIGTYDLNNYEQIWANNNNVQDYYINGTSSNNYSKGSIDISLDSTNTSTSDIQSYIKDIANMTLSARQNSEIYYDGSSNTSYAFQPSTASDTSYPHIASIQAQNTFPSDVSWKAYSLNYHIIIVNGDLTVNMPSGYEPGPNDYAVFISLNGSITINQGSTLRGLVYAPNGNIILNGNPADSTLNILGSVVGQRVQITHQTTITQTNLNIPSIDMNSSSTNSTSSVTLIN